MRIIPKTRTGQLQTAPYRNPLWGQFHKDVPTVLPIRIAPNQPLFFKVLHDVGERPRSPAVLFRDAFRVRRMRCPGMEQCRQHMVIPALEPKGFIVSALLWVWQHAMRSTLPKMFARCRETPFPIARCGVAYNLRHELPMG